MANRKGHEEMSIGQEEKVERGRRGKMKSFLIGGRQGKEE